jgi:hypothetical protein
MNPDWTRDRAAPRDLRLCQRNRAATVQQLIELDVGQEEAVDVEPAAFDAATRVDLTPFPGSSRTRGRDPGRSAHCSRSGSP